MKGGILVGKKQSGLLIVALSEDFGATSSDCDVGSERGDEKTGPTRERLKTWTRRMIPDEDQGTGRSGAIAEKILKNLADRAMNTINTSDFHRVAPNAASADNVTTPRLLGLFVKPPHVHLNVCRTW